MDVAAAVQRARDRLVKENKPMIVYRRRGRVAVISLAEYIDADLCTKGAKRVYVATRNAKGKII